MKKSKNALLLNADHRPHIVHLSWLYHCTAHYQRVDERTFPISLGGNTHGAHQHHQHHPTHVHQHQRDPNQNRLLVDPALIQHSNQIITSQQLMNKVQNMQKQKQQQQQQQQHNKHNKDQEEAQTQEQVPAQAQAQARSASGTSSEFDTGVPLAILAVTTSLGPTSTPNNSHAGTTVIKIRRKKAKAIPKTPEEGDQTS